MKTIALLAIALASLLLSGCATRSSQYRQLAEQIRNEHILWDGNTYGLHVYALGEPEQRLLIAGKACRPFLIEALKDESRDVAAHVLLTLLQGSYSFSPTEWNQLRVILHADGHAEIPEGQRAAIQKLWTGEESPANAPAK